MMRPRKSALAYVIVAALPALWVEALQSSLTFGRTTCPAQITAAIAADPSIVNNKTIFPEKPHNPGQRWTSPDGYIITIYACEKYCRTDASINTNIAGRLAT